MENFDWTVWSWQDGDWITMRREVQPNAWHDTMKAGGLDPVLVRFLVDTRRTHSRDTMSRCLSGTRVILVLKAAGGACLSKVGRGLRGHGPSDRPRSAGSSSDLCLPEVDETSSRERVTSAPPQLEERYNSRMSRVRLGGHSRPSEGACAAPPQVSHGVNPIRRRLLQIDTFWLRKLFYRSMRS